MASPEGITLGNTDVIIEVSDDVAVNTAQTQRVFSGGYVRQIGAIVSRASVDDFVQYDPRDSVVFSQGGVTYSFIKEEKIYFTQAPAT